MVISIKNMSEKSFREVYWAEIDMNKTQIWTYNKVADACKLQIYG